MMNEGKRGAWKPEGWWGRIVSRVDKGNVPADCVTSFVYFVPASLGRRRIKVLTCIAMLEELLQCTGT